MSQERRQAEGAEFVVDKDPRCPRGSAWWGRCVFNVGHRGPCAWQNAPARVAAQKENQKP